MNMTRESFSVALASWLQARSYSIGAAPRDTHEKRDVLLAKAAMIGVKQLAHARVPGSGVSQGAGADEIDAALVPILQVVDLAALKSAGPWLGARLIVVIYADELPPEKVRERFDALLRLSGPLCRAGMQGASPGAIPIMVHALVVYFDTSRFDICVPALLPHAKREALGQGDGVLLEAAFVNVPEGKVRWPEARGLDVFAVKLGIKKAPFGEDDLRHVRMVASGGLVQSREPK